jgi:hypothetical protein
MPKRKGNKRTAMSRSRCSGKFVSDISIVESSSTSQNTSNLDKEYPIDDVNNGELDPILIDEANNNDDDEEDDDGDSYYDLDVLDEDLNLDLDNHRRIQSKLLNNLPKVFERYGKDT